MTKRDAAPTDPLHAHCLELCQELEVKAQRLRDYATTPGNAWLAQGELQQISQLLSELDATVAEIKLVEQLHQG